MLFRTKFARKWILGCEFRKSKSQVGISSSKISCVQMFRQNDKLWPSDANLPKNKFSGRNFENLSPYSESAPPRYHVCQFLDTTDSFGFFGPSLPKNIFCGQNFKNQSPDLKSAPQKYHARQFLCKTVNSSV